MHFSSKSKDYWCWNRLHFCCISAAKYQIDLKLEIATFSWRICWWSVHVNKYANMGPQKCYISSGILILVGQQLARAFHHLDRIYRKISWLNGMFSVVCSPSMFVWFVWRYVTLHDSIQWIVNLVIVVDCKRGKRALDFTPFRAILHARLSAFL